MLNALFAFLGAFTLFVFEPFLGKALTPRYGGGAQIWILCLLFFQIVVLLGYTYGHFLGRVPFKRQVLVHVSLLALSLAVAATRGAGLWHPALGSAGTAEPTLSLLGDLFFGAAFPLVLLSATSPLAHRWYVSSEGGSPYHLYAWSNAGSLLGLVVYPLLIEPFSTLGVQAWLLWGLICLVLLFVLVLSFQSDPVSAITGELERVSPRTVAEWVVWGALGSAALVAATAKLSHEVGSMPLLWIAPLFVYLLSFILVFDARWSIVGKSWRPFWCLLGAAGLTLLGGLKGPGIGRPILSLFGAMLFTGGISLVCHGNLYDRRPEPRLATVFLLAAALGGVFGGLATALGAPFLLDHLIEVGLLAVGVGVVILLSAWRMVETRVSAMLAALVLVAVGGWVIRLNLSGSGLYFRNFYGVVHLDKQGSFLVMSNLQTIHGAVDRARPDAPTTYYTPESGLGRSISMLRDRKGSLRVCVLGLGSGSAAAYAKPGDVFEFLELNPLVADLAGPYPNAPFPFLAQCKGSVRLRVGDGRSLLERDRTMGERGRYDLLMIDAFSGDSVPWHLLTEEAFDLYNWHLATDGILLMHVSNPLPVDLTVLRGAYSRGFFAAMLLDAAASGQTDVLSHSANQYILLSRSPGVLNDARVYAQLLVGLSGGHVLAREPFLSHLVRALKRPAWRDDRCSQTDLLLEKPLATLTMKPNDKL